MLEQKAKITGNGFLIVKHGNRLMMNNLAQVLFHLLHKPWVTRSFRDGHGDLHSSSYICDSPASQWQLHHPPAQHHFSMPSALAILQGPVQPWERGAGRTMAPAAHRGPPANTPRRHSEALPQQQSDFRHNNAFRSLANNFLIYH